MRGTVKNVAEISPRENSVICNLSHVQCIIKRDRLLLFNTHRPVVQDFALQLQNFLLYLPSARAESKEQLAPPFELLCLEAIFIAISNKYARRMSCFEPIVGSLIEKLCDGSTPSEEALQRLVPLKNSLKGFKQATVRHELRCEIQGMRQTGKKGNGNGGVGRVYCADQSQLKETYCR